MFSLQSSESVLKVLAERMRVLRLSHNLSQVELAQMTGSSLSSIRRLEASGQGTLLLLVRVAQALRAEQGLDGLFVNATHSIADLEQSAKLAGRVRSRKSRKVVV
jgi:transcriptional regulator with XRE-family HTH domain